MKRYLHLAFYGLLSAAPLFIFTQYSIEVSKIFSKQTLSVLSYFVIGALILSAYLGFKVNQTRILFSSIALLGIFKLDAISSLNRATGFNDYLLIKIALIAYPIFLLFNFLLRESRILSFRTAIRILLFLSPITGLIFLAKTNIPLFTKITSPDYLTSYDSYIASTMVWLFFIFAHKEAKVKEFTIAATIGLIAFYTWGFIEMANPKTMKGTKELYKILSFATLSLLYLHSILMMYWKRVYVDELTALSNRRALNERVDALGSRYSIAMIDVDHFKKFNDTYGHDQGDDVLKLVAKTLESVLGDKVFRYGGEEFAAVFSNELDEDTLETLDEVREKLANIKFHVRTQKASARKKKNRGQGGGKKVNVTISIGVSEISQKADTPEKVIKMADNALYKAKKKGRNCVVAA